MNIDGIIKTVKKEVADYLIENGKAELTTEKTQKDINNGRNMDGIICK